MKKLLCIFAVICLNVNYGFAQVNSNSDYVVDGIKEVVEIITPRLLMQGDLGYQERKWLLSNYFVNGHIFGSETCQNHEFKVTCDSATVIFYINIGCGNVTEMSLSADLVDKKGISSVSVFVEMIQGEYIVSLESIYISFVDYSSGIGRSASRAWPKKTDENYEKVLIECFEIISEAIKKK